MKLIQKTVEAVVQDKLALRQQDVTNTESVVNGTVRNVVGCAVGNAVGNAVACAVSNAVVNAVVSAVNAVQQQDSSQHVIVGTPVNPDEGGNEVETQQPRPVLTVIEITSINK